ncbi:MupA/Atu3671 family FMN-dependent luciferase-like monooxygenase [Agarilytica rhodophyticola]|uniref:MupA/Atu3671 family FMN-dependent luciferase-like monooxygenase n=1 Tax=Agarilytica rhodophyticola TaxID=1737490 RepID=UPI0013154984|nr:MupA/Atu3671 family FMN-dependent luciferase-like monooxygenase [Agarilytica rhodophyticola]
MQFGLMFFASSQDSLSGNIYELIKECAIFGDQHGFSSLWVPERHFTEFGGIYNNPAILHAAIAMLTKNIRLHSGSVVMPINDPVRVAEQWSMVDNLSNGRAGLSVAAGWHPNDFIFFPEHYHSKHDVMYEGIDVLQTLWQGGSIKRKNGVGDNTDVKIYPTPVNQNLPLYLTVSSSPLGFKKAGAMGLNILTSVLDQTLEELAEKVVMYRAARAQNGYDPSSGVVTLMLHSYIGEDELSTKEEARKPYCTFIKNNKDLMKGLANNRGTGFDVDELSDTDMDEFVNFLYDRFSSTKGLIGSVESCRPLLKQVEESGVNEIACLLDFGPTREQILNNLLFLKKLMS